MGEAVLDDIVGELFGQFGVAQSRPPRPEVHLIGAHRLEDRVAQRALSHPVLVGPGVVALEHPRRGLRGHLGGEGHRVGPLGHRAVGAVDTQLVEPVVGEAGPEQLPDAGGAQHAHLRLVAPVIEIADHADALGIGCPHGERHTGDLTVGGREAPRVCAQRLPETLVATLGEQVQVDLAQGRQEPVGVGNGVDERRLVLGVADLEAVVDEVGERHRDGEQPGLDVGQRMAGAADQRVHLHRVRAVHPDHRVVVVFVGAQHRVRVVVLTGQQPVQVGGVRPQMRTVDLVGQVGRVGHVVTPYAEDSFVGRLESGAC